MLLSKPYVTEAFRLSKYANVLKHGRVFRLDICERGFAIRHADR